VASPLTLKIEKWTIWIVFIGIVALLHHLFPVIFLTFILAYMGNTLVNAMTRRWPRRRLNLCLLFATFLLVLTGVGVLVVPKMFGEARQLAMFYIAREAEPPPGTPAAAQQADETAIDRQTRRYVDSILIAFVGRQQFQAYAQSESYEALLVRVESSIKRFIPKVVSGVRRFVNASISVFLQFLLSIILSFLILWDLPALKAGITSLSTGRTADIYAEIAPGMSAFGVMLGRAFEAQTGIAIVNAILTSIGFLLLGIPSIALLATIVFFCSYVPVVGVMLSTLPAALFAFKLGGVTMVGWLFVMVLVVHAVEAYALNPIIYGRHMKMHPVAILMILLVGEHLFGIWGLVLGVPIAAFVWTHVIGGRSTATKPAIAAPVGGGVEVDAVPVIR
jgi:predicted PurR-regulated permease PerM